MRETKPHEPPSRISNHHALDRQPGSGHGRLPRLQPRPEVSGPGKASTIACSSAKAFRGDASRYHPEELLIAALSNCHMLSMLNLCADAGITVTAYTDEATGIMRLNPDGSGEFISVTLRPSGAISMVR